MDRLPHMELLVLIVIGAAFALMLFSARSGAPKHSGSPARPRPRTAASVAESATWFGSGGEGGSSVLNHRSGDSHLDGGFHSDTNAPSDGGGFDGGGGGDGGGD